MAARRDPVDDQDARSTRSQGGFWNNIVLLIGSVALVGVVVWGVPYAVEQLQKQGGFRPEIILPVILLIGLITLIGALAGLAATFSRLGLASETAPLGMPEGSVQAVIALGLIIIFAIVGVYLIGGEDPTRLLPGLTRAEFEVLPTGSIVEIRGIGGGRFDVRVAAPDSNQHELALQLLTTVSTLVVAVAAFYFGQKSVGEASKAIGIASPALTGLGQSAGAVGASVASSPIAHRQGDEEVPSTPSASAPGPDPPGAAPRST